MGRPFFIFWRRWLFNGFYLKKKTKNLWRYWLLTIKTPVLHIFNNLKWLLWLFLSAVFILKEQISDDMTASIQDLERIIKKLQEQISNYSKVAGYKVNTQKLIAYLYTSNEKFEMKSTVTFKIVVPQIKYLNINLKKCTSSR